MTKKTFIILQFGKPFPWINKFIESVRHLEQYGWHWKIFTPNLSNLDDDPTYFYPSNVETVIMNINQFCKLVGKKTGITPKIFITDKGIPSIHVTDFMVAYGKIFEDYLKDSDFWGMMGGPDILFGRLDHFLPDSYLEDCDIFTDDPKFINGCFTLFRNTPTLNELFTQITNWKTAFKQKDCLRCTTGRGAHSLFGTDEYGLTEVMKTSKLRYKHPKYYPLHGHDRLERHEIELKEDGSLWELNRDNPPLWSNAIPEFGREILFYHFSQTKKWPLI